MAGVTAVGTDRVTALLHSRTAWLIFASESASFREGHIPGSLDHPPQAVAAALARSRPVVVYGTGRKEDGAATRFAALLEGAGVDVSVYVGGLAAWQEAGLPVDVF